MPYITKDERERADTNPVYGQGNPGILAYRLNKAIIEWLPKDFRFADLDAALGALVATQEEFYRRVVGPYEDQAMRRNGEVYPAWLLSDND